MTLKRPPLLITILTLCGLILAILSGTDLCNFGGCTIAHEYSFHGLSLPLVGLAYFGLLSAAVLLSTLTVKAELLVSLLLAGGAGTEITLLHLQKSVIQAWCPLCVTIAILVYTLCLLQLYRFVTETRRYNTMNRRTFIAKILLVLAAAVTGFIVSFTGISRPDAEAAQLDTSLGKLGSKVEVYVFSDWLCPVCVKIEPAIEGAYPQLEKRAKVYFLDKPVHKEAMNFVPYHLSFLVHEKPKYLKLRRALFDLAKKNRNPSVEDVKAAVAPLGVTYRQLSFMDVTQMMGTAQALAAQYKVNATPTVVVVNSITRKSKTLVGGGEITQDNLLKAVKSLE